MSKETLKLTIESLVRLALDEVLPQIEEALKQEQDEPDYWLGYGLQAHTEKPFEDATPLYTKPQPSQKPMTDEQIERLIFKSGGHRSTQNLMSNPMQTREYIELWNERIYAFARAIEAAHGIKE